MFMYIYGNLPYSLSDIFIFTYDIHIHETKQSSQIRPFANYAVRSSNTLIYKGPVIWNAIPTIIQKNNSLKKLYCN